MEICGLCPFDVAMTWWCFQSQVTSGLGNQFTWHSRIVESIGFASGCDGAVHRMHCAWTSLRQIRSGQTSHQSLVLATCAFCTACIVTNGQARLTSSLFDWQTRQDTLPSGEAGGLGLHRLSCEVASGSHFLTVCFSLFQMHLSVHFPW